MSGNAPELPWTRGELTILRSVLDEIDREALRTYPSEACGFIYGPASQPHALTRVEHQVNLADKYHALDPVSFPRTSKMYFKIDELKAMRALENGEKNGEPLKVIYHSHCDAGAYFSEEDAATFANGGQLMWPCAFLVVSVQNAKIADHKLWIHVPRTNQFEESRLEVR